ncbi:hypothetical protein B0T17DRAFT_602602 [Bombardia bombarda]|uniref:Uncharacterized protein n=1 Tax=Bombardia bombarda TaxID=252184 RepID=A0AA39U7W1_9PEZI|nr:hypothetical protein B0T17DRAFT_602602 [Bombardia bombarda]
MQTIGYGIHYYRTLLTIETESVLTIGGSCRCYLSPPRTWVRIRPKAEGPKRTGPATPVTLAQKRKHARKPPISQVISTGYLPSLPAAPTPPCDAQVLSTLQAGEILYIHDDQGLQRLEKVTAGPISRQGGIQPRIRIPKRVHQCRNATRTSPMGDSARHVDGSSGRFQGPEGVQEPFIPHDAPPLQFNLAYPDMTPRASPPPQSDAVTDRMGEQAASRHVQFSTIWPGRLALNVVQAKIAERTPQFPQFPQTPNSAGSGRVGSSHVRFVEPMAAMLSRPLKVVLGI